MENKAFMIEGERVSLRLIEESDFPLIVKWRNNDRVKQNFIYRENFSLEGQKKWKETMIDTGRVIQFIICEKSRDNRPVGSVYLRDINKDNLSAEYGVFIGEDDASGKGYGNEAALLMTEYAGKELKLKELILRVFVYNISAIKSYENAGFEKTEYLPDVVCSDGHKGDMIMMKKTFS
ncbi:N-acetyltransferase [Butyrivibrio sp. CB08]|uniref:GNAT family N-acetyltransferase n=1 Tax=Butyrivibrio sp. CB08 TaxID=2364879 RepID=UPI000EAA55FE|nr:GNAT family protein [Butyrivibrio sp. CB08]RKM59820.1 N-acetyltransferase [Butyrivibrio sp. CB08]